MGWAKMLAITFFSKHIPKNHCNVCQLLISKTIKQCKKFKQLISPLKTKITVSILIQLLSYLGPSHTAARYWGCHRAQRGWCAACRSPSDTFLPADQSPRSWPGGHGCPSPQALRTRCPHGRVPGGGICDLMNNGVLLPMSSSFEFCTSKCILYIHVIQTNFNFS